MVDTTGKSPLANGTQIVVPQYTSYINPAFTSITEVTSNINLPATTPWVFELSNKSSKTFQFDANYTWSHALDYNQQAGHHDQHEQHLRSRWQPAPGLR